MGKAHGGGKGHGFFNVRRRVPPPDGLQDAVLQGLGIHADAVAAVVQKHLQLLPVNGIGPSGLDTVFRAAGKVKVMIQVGQEPVHLVGGEGGRRAAAHVKALHPQPQVPHRPCRPGNFSQQRLQIRLHEPEALLHRLGHEAAIGAAGGAEGNADV